MLGLRFGAGYQTEFEGFGIFWLGFRYNKQRGNRKTKQWEWNYIGYSGNMGVYLFVRKSLGFSPFLLVLLPLQ